MGVIMKNKVNYTGGGSGGGGNANEMTLTMAEYLALTEEQRMDGTTYYITDAVSTKEIQPVIYSEEEREIGVWRDGKPIYQKTWTGLNVTPSYNSWSNIIPNDVNIETLVRWQALSNVDYKNLDGTGIEWQVYGGYIRAEYNQNANVRTIEILTLQYTKTTDTAGSGTWTTNGAPAVHYDGNEKIIGTWFGETLYEKTWDLGSEGITISSQVWSDTTISKTGFDIIVSVNGINAEGAVWDMLGARANSSSTNYLQLYSARNTTINIKYLTIQYTKSS